MCLCQYVASRVRPGVCFGVPKLWKATIDAHRGEVRDAILDTTAQLAGELGLLNVTMSQIAEQTGIGRATLYKYFSSVEDILRAWHGRQISGHLTQLTELAQRNAPPMQRLVSVLETYARIQRHRSEHSTQRHGPQLAAFLHRDDAVAPAEQQLRRLVRGLLAEAAADGKIRSDVSPDELATFCLHALHAAGGLSSKAATERLTGLVLDGLRPR